MRSLSIPLFARSARLAAWLLACSFVARPAFADFSGTPTTFKTNGGWCWFQDPRALISNGHLVFGSVAGVTASGSTGGDENATDYNFATGAVTTSLLHTALNQDDHAAPALALLPDGRFMVVYAGHGTNNFVYWRVSANAGDGTAWAAEQTSTANPANDGNANSYSNPFYLSLPNTLFNFSRAIGYDPNYSKITGLNASDNRSLTNAANFVYGGHYMYWKNPGTGTLTGGNGRPYVKYASNGADTVWFATTEDSPQNYLNSLYGGYIKFTGAGAGTVYNTAGTALGGISTGTAPTGGSNPPTNGNQGAIASGTGNSYLPTQFTPIAKANASLNGLDLSGASAYGAGYVPWASSMQLDGAGNPYLGFVILRNLNGGYGNSLDYGYARLVNGAWKVSRVGYGGLPLYNGQNQYAGLIAVDPVDPNKVYISTDVDPVSKATLLGPDGKQHWQIFAGATADGGATWSWTQLTNTASDNIRPVAVAGGGKAALLWMQGSYTSYTSYNMNIVGLVQSLPVPVITSAASMTKFKGADFSYQITATNSPTSFSAGGLPAGLSIDPATGLISGALNATGTSNITLNAVNNYGAGTAALTLSVVQESFAAWQSQWFTSAQLADPAVSGDAASPAGDGMSNLLKYAFNLNPLTNGAGALPLESTTTSGGANYLTLTYTQNRFASDISYLPEVSGDLRTWGSGGGSVAPVSAVNNADGITQTVTVQDTTPMGAAPRFIRLRVTRP